MLVHRFLHAINFRHTRSRKCEIMATTTSRRRSKSRIANDFVAIFPHSHGVRPDNPRRNDVTRRASNAYVLRCRGRFRRWIRKGGVTSAAECKRFDRICMGEVFVFPGTMMQRLFPFCSDFRVTIATTFVLGQTNTGNGRRLFARRRTGKGNIVRAALIGDEQKRADQGHANTRQINTQTHARQRASTTTSLSIVIVGEHYPRARFSRAASSRSCTTIRATRSSNVSFGFQPRICRAFDASARSKSTSAGRKYRGSIFTKSR